MPIHHLKKLSAYSRTDDHVAERTLSGAVITILGALLMCVLFVNEVSIFMTPQVRHTMAVATDPTSGHEEGYSIWINVTFPALHCDFAGISEMDQSGGRQKIDDSHDEHHGKREDSIIKWRLKHHTLGDVLGQYEKLDHRLRREGVFMSPIEMAQRRVTEALQDPEGCRLEGHVSVPRVKGTIVFGINGIFPVGSHIDNFQWVMPKETIFNLSHTFDTFTFGEALPGHNYNLHGVTRVFQAVQDTYGFTRYFLQVVPTIYRPARGREESTNQYSITEYFSPSFEGPAGLFPTVEVFYDVSPIKMEVTTRYASTFHLLTQLCAVVGGAFSLTGMLDKWVHQIVALGAKAKAGGWGAGPAVGVIQ